MPVAPVFCNNIFIILSAQKGDSFLLVRYPIKFQALWCKKLHFSSTEFAGSENYCVFF